MRFFDKADLHYDLLLFFLVYRIFCGSDMNELGVVDTDSLREAIVEGFEAIAYVKALKVTRLSEEAGVFEREKTLDGQWFILSEEISSQLQQVFISLEVDRHRLLEDSEREGWYVNRTVTTNERRVLAIATWGNRHVSENDTWQPIPHRKRIPKHSAKQQRKEWKRKWWDYQERVRIYGARIAGKTTTFHPQHSDEGQYPKGTLDEEGR